MNSFEEYKKAKIELFFAEKWAELIGKPYRGGGGGIGKLHSVYIEATIYHQVSDGATNYHDSEKPINAALAEAVKDHFALILTSALEKMRLNLRNLAERARQEYQILMEDEKLI